MNINEAIKFLIGFRFEIDIKNNNTYILNDIDSSDPLEIYDKKELINLAKQIKNEKL